MAHSRGPWKVIKNGWGWQVATTDQSRGVPVICSLSKIEGDKPFNQAQEANANLIATTPEMLAAIDKMLSALDEARNNFPGEYEDFVSIDNIQDGIDELNAAYAKAKGS